MKVLAVLFATFSFAIADSNVVPEPNVTSQLNNSEIIGGGVLIHERWMLPWNVAILNKDGTLRCNGILIGPTKGLTSAHCAIASFMVRVGSDFYNSGGRLISATAFPHHRYRECGTPFTVNCFDYDIGVFTLADEAIDVATFIDLYDGKARFKPETVGMISGWGKTGPRGVVNTRLRQISLPMVANNKCSAAYGAYQLCARPVRGQAVCNGDDGSPLIIGRKLAGIVVSANGCNRPGKSVVFASIPAYRDWISIVSGVQPDD